MANKEQKDGIPLWIKRTGAFIGLIAAAVTVTGGIHTLVKEYRAMTLEIEKERTKQIQAAEAQEKIKLEQSIREVEIEKERTRQREAESRRSQSELQKQQNELRRDEAIRLRQEVMQREQRVLQAIADFVDGERPALSAVLTLSEFAEPDGEYQDLLITAFTAKTEKTSSVAEARLMFKLLDAIGVSAFASVVHINRIALKQFSQELLTLFWSQIQITIESTHNNSDKNRNREIDGLFEQHPADLIAPVIRRIYQQVLSFDPQFQSLIMTEEWTRFEASYKSFLLPSVNKPSIGDIDRAFQQTQALFKVEDIETVRNKLIVSGEILTQSKQFIGKFLPAAAQMGNYTDRNIDLSGTYLVGLQIDSGDFRHLTLDFDDALFRPNADIFDHGLLQSGLNKESENSFKEAQQNIERRLQKMEQFMIL